jgi:hypothetical protein
MRLDRSTRVVCMEEAKAKKANTRRGGEAGHGISEDAVRVADGRRDLVRNGVWYCGPNNVSSDYH